MAIEGQVREASDSQDQSKKVGVFEGKVVVINPTMQEFKDILGIELSENSKGAEYLGERDNNTTLRLSVWLQNVKTEQFFNVNFFLEDKERENKDKTKYQYINQIGMTSWAASEDELANWFKGSGSNQRDYRIAYVGEEELYDFMRNWLSKINFSADGADFTLNWKKLMKGNVSEISEQIDGLYETTVVAIATVVTKEKEGEVREFQGIYNKAFLPGKMMKHFRLSSVDYNDRTVVENISRKKSKDLRPHERFIVKISGEYGCKDYYTFQELEEYNPDMNLVASEKVIAEDDSDY
jgi:hypothetical protein